ncbi:MAG: hypothetical protein ACLFS0_01040 [Bacteroidales bacterium]
MTMTKPDLQQIIHAFSELGNEMRQAARLLNRGYRGVTVDDGSAVDDSGAVDNNNTGSNSNDISGTGEDGNRGNSGRGNDENYLVQRHGPGVQSLLDSVEASRVHNPWFTRQETAGALDALGRMLQKDKLETWAGGYAKRLQEARGPQVAGEPQKAGEPQEARGLQEVQAPKTVAVIMAGNIPLVGFHDFMCVLFSGHHFLGKLSSQDPVLPVTVARMLTRHAPGLEKFIAFTSGQIDSGDVGAVIATGSDNTARYFEFRFGDKPRIIRKNRNSAAVLSGREPEAVLEALGKDVFSYFGLGCRNVSHLLIPEDFDLSRLAAAWVPFKSITGHPKYRHNLTYHKALFTLKEQPFTDAGCCLLAESARTASPVSVVHYSRYRNFPEATAFLMEKKDRLQCVVAAGDFLPGNRTTVLPGTGKVLTGTGMDHPGAEINLPGVETVLPGESQQPGPGDYADGVDTMDFLLSLS